MVSQLPKGVRAAGVAGTLAATVLATTTSQAIRTSNE
jgi:hypothetical protein